MSRNKEICFNQKVPLEKSFLVDQELHTNLEIVNNSSTVKFILGCYQNLSLIKRKLQWHDTVMDWYSSINIIR